MSHILQFSVEGLAGRKGTYSLKLNRDLNVFFGSNGSGKTSLLKILHSAMEDEAGILENVPFKKAEVEIFSVTYDQLLVRNISQRTDNKLEPEGADARLVDRVKLITIAREQNAWSTSPKKPKISGLSHQYLPISRLYSSAPPRTFRTTAGGLIYEEGPDRLSEEQLDRMFAAFVKQLWTIYSASISKAVREAQQKGLARILREVVSRTEERKELGPAPIEAKEAYRRVASFLAREPGFSDVLGSFETFSESYDRDPNLRKVARDIEEVERDVEKATAPREELARLVDGMFIGGKHLVLGDEDLEVKLDKDRKIALPFLSSGEKQLLFLLIETLVANVNTILIDEPELSMHVDWQKTLVRSMQLLNPNAQIILATHSPEIMADIPDDKIFRL